MAESIEQQSQEAVEYCYGHRDRPTRLHCTRCDRPICGQCAIPASVGQHCPECVAEARRSAPKVRTAMAVNAPAVRAIIIATVIVYVGQALFGALTFNFGSAPRAVAAGEWYRLLTAMFLHMPFNGSLFSLLHIGFNMYVLSMYGPQVEQTFGTSRFVFMYLATGFFASATSYTFSDCRSLSVGASGAIFGVVGILLVYLYNRRASTFAGQFLRGILFFVALNLMIGFTLRGIDNFAHIGGLLSGMALGAGFDRSTRARANAPLALQVVTGVAVVGVGLGLVMYRTATFTC